jgi:hypothetical protein
MANMLAYKKIQQKKDIKIKSKAFPGHAALQKTSTRRSLGPQNSDLSETKRKKIKYFEEE